ncbi:hypothetical protein ABB55_27255 [Prosthecomicrobium hirschii]|uniref:Uncharacterized protein n=1 Tax=Prosthecodimorpha hirschii TaxID=665126 RepID=A0A0P6VVR0_9HYPH|nr:hypothetical protein [Prosthecomicrobium hirschii]KPL55477.1 hypothetical protein ABB55_27255 [Prosthecomicrobium hirschii]
MRDSYHNFTVSPVIAPVVVSDNTAQVGTVINRAGYRSLTYVIATGTLADADATFTALLEESDSSGSGFTAVADADLVGTEAAVSFTYADDGVTRKLGYVGNKQYTKLTITPANNSGSAPIAAVAILGRPTSAPAA